ncbi:hypothetical protein Mterra_03208 [Calidithermus terrae]|uniref:Uncharacterized protein n=1 Tax=Calidithermus terrae TaxID=1408545 RepID=A0A399E9F3_9DEIN|nr:hypothetical protein [Calidithermus terrae]RIH81364.1 hypothetical protein Mterra_03208 [Calidithermus terrae]
MHRVEGLPQVYVARGSENYLVDLERESCACPDRAKGNTREHLLAALLLPEVIRLNAEGGWVGAPSLL